MQSGDGLSLEAASVCVPTTEDGPRKVFRPQRYMLPCWIKILAFLAQGVNQLACSSTEKRYQ